MRPASFRGVPFAVTSARTQVEQLADEYVFPGRTDPTKVVRIGHLGAGPRRYVIEAYVYGDDYHERRDALEAALAELSPGRLVHPYRGERTVSIVGTSTTIETPQRGGYARISFQCVDVSEAGLRTRVDTSALVERDLDAAIEALAADFGESMEAADGLTLEDAETAWNGGQSKLSAAAAFVSDLSSAANEATTRVSAVTADFQKLTQAPVTVVTAYARAARAIGELPESLKGTVIRDGKTVAEEAYGIIKRAFFEDPLKRIKAIPFIELVQRRVDATNGTAFVVRLGGLFGAAQAVASGDISSREAATGYRAELRDELDDLASRADNALFEALQRLRTSIGAHLDEVAKTLPELRTIELREDEPALVLAHRLYGDARQAADILDRNNVPHPGRIAAGSSLEVVL
jgi:prophage DNA circulation protein